MSAHENYPVDEEPQPRSSIESRRSRMSKMTSNSVEPMPPIPSAPPLLPETKLDVSLSFDSIIGDINFEGADVDPKKKELMEKRQSNVLKLAEENEKLNAELKAMSERLAAAERRTQAILAARERKAKQGMENSEGGQQHQQHQHQHQHQQGTSAGAF